MIIDQLTRDHGAWSNKKKPYRRGKNTVISDNLLFSY